MSKQPQPAQDTKHISPLRYPFKSHVFELEQSNDGASNGTTLWLGGQVLTAYLGDALPAVQHIPPVSNPRYLPKLKLTLCFIKILSLAWLLCLVFVYTCSLVCRLESA